MADPQQPDKAGKSEPLQWLRELMAVVISVVILTLSSCTIWRTFEAAGATAETPKMAAGGDEKEAKQRQIDAYNRQKDVLLYVLALFGTVTGYYLGRVPAEANAKRAENAADTAQKQLSKTQDRLTDASASASTASAQLGQERGERAKAVAGLKTSTQALRDVRATLASAAGDQLPGRNTLARTAADGDGGGGGVADARLKRAQDRIDAALEQIEAQALS